MYTGAQTGVKTTLPHQQVHGRQKWTTIFLSYHSKGSGTAPDIRLLTRLPIEVTDEADANPLFETGYHAVHLIPKIVFRYVVSFICGRVAHNHD